MRELADEQKNYLFSRKPQVIEREKRQLKRINEILKKAAVLFCSVGARPQTKEMVAFIFHNRSLYSVEPICRLLPIAYRTINLLPQ